MSSDEAIKRATKRPDRLLIGSAGLLALMTSSCCILPMLLLVMGLGGSWIAVFGKVAATSLIVLGMSTAIVALAWFLAYRNHALSQLKSWLAGSTALIIIAWIIVYNETRINDFLITLM